MGTDRWRPVRRTVAVIGLSLAAAAQAHAKWMAPTEMPVERLLKTTTDYVRSHPKDAQGYYMLGRINSAAFAADTDTVAVYKGEPLPQFPGFAASPVQPREPAKPLTARALTYYANAVHDYFRATQLDPKSAIAQLGLGFECEEGLRSDETVRRAWGALALPGKPRVEGLRTAALGAYRRAYDAAKAQDLKLTNGGFALPISQEAAAGIIGLQKGHKLTGEEKNELASLQDHVRHLAALPRVITPILISFDGKILLNDLLEAGAHTGFDLAGDGAQRQWPWVKPTTGILAWDPKHTGKITSGLQLFGSVTWWLFWKDGYAPLAALDDDHNGVLEGAELDGIVVWFDRNGNGISDPGEVVTVQALGIVRIAVRADKSRDGALWNSAGVELHDGRSLATFDWTPTSLTTRQ